MWDGSCAYHGYTELGRWSERKRITGRRSCEAVGRSCYTASYLRPNGRVGAGPLPPQLAGGASSGRGRAGRGTASAGSEGRKCRAAAAAAWANGRRRERGPTGDGGSGEQGPTGDRGDRGARFDGGERGAGCSRRSHIWQGQRERSAREGGGAGQERSGRRWGTGDFCYIYQWQKWVILYKFDGDVSNPHAPKLRKLLPPSFLTVGKN